ncbi:E3 ubiquitin-protein ligase TRIM11-like [Dromiciops gliroides]|uniref:E3 ubiquitin-protein ligase TRIM11-like n=1 Tax=Dromiciops gliroides TaxID=33562 RepID=UPI001CC3BF2A|nr:E3 ubiquitin-protein ligase TRIM11-like [Dromiciops gliroides]
MAAGTVQDNEKSCPPGAVISERKLGCCRKEAVAERRMAAARERLQELLRDITCAVCQSYFSEPVTIECGHSFCRACLSLSWRVGTTNFSCPECRQVPQVRELPAVNRHLAQLTEVGKELTCQLFHSAEGQHQCATHKKVFKLFCENDQIAVCMRCSQSPEHGAHMLSPVEEAAPRFREKLQHTLSQVEKHLEEAEKLLAQEEEPAVDWLSMITGEYCQLHDFFLEEESRYLERIKQEERTSFDRISHHRQRLQDIIYDLQEAGQRPNVDLLQDAKQLLARSESVLSQRSKAVIPELRECPIPGLIEMLRRFTVDITVNPTSASPFVTVSEDKKSVKASDAWQVGTKHPEFSPGHYVFAEQAFSSGRQYWEVDVSQLPQWALGVIALQLRRRDGNVDYIASVFLLQCAKKEDDYYLQTYPISLKHRVKGPVPREQSLVP